MQNCEYCGKPLTEGQENCCSAECEAAAQGEKPARQSMHETQCVLCGKTFVGGYAARYCPDCKPIARRNSLNRAAERKKHGGPRILGDDAVCESCGKIYTRTGSRQKVCLECAREKRLAAQHEYYKRKLEEENQFFHVADLNEERVCPVCGNTFIRSGACRTYCSRECAAKGQKHRQQEQYAEKRGTPRTKTCPICGNTFTYGKAHKFYCSLKCANEAINQRNRIRWAEKYYKSREYIAPSPEEKTCPICGNTFTYCKAHRVYCSAECMKEAQAQHHTRYTTRKELAQTEDTTSNAKAYVACYLPVEHLRKLDEECKALGKSRSACMCIILEKYFENKGNDSNDKP